MARLDAKWGNFWNRGQTWYHFWQDANGTGGTALVLDLSDSVTISDSAVKNIVLSKVDSVTISDNTVKTAFVLKADNVTISDAKSNGLSLVITDNVTVTDQDAKIVNYHIEDSVIVSDSATAEIVTGGQIYTLLLSDSVTISDTLTKTLIKKSSDGGSSLRPIIRERDYSQAIKEDEILLMVIKGFFENINRG